MKYPTLQEERKLWKKGYKAVVGLDEAGRGPLAGPVVAAAVVLRNPKFAGREADSPKGCILNSKQYQNPKSKCSKRVLDFGHWDLFGVWGLGFGVWEVRDSKKLSSKAREKFYKILIRHPTIQWGIGKVSEKAIDKINILEATKLAMKRAIEKLKAKSEKRKIDYLILDGNFKIDLKIPQKSIIKADEKVFSCAAASIIAKVYRDKIMREYHKGYPQYNFDKHKGYPTKLHLKRLKKYGPCKIHRRSFGPVRISNSKCKMQKSK